MGVTGRRAATPARAVPGHSHVDGPAADAPAGEAGLHGPLAAPGRRLPAESGGMAGLLMAASDAVDRLTLAAAALLAAAMTGALVLQVLFRFVLKSPLSWSEEFARYCFVWLSSLGAAAGLKRGLHPALDVWTGAWGRRVREWTGALALVLAGAFVAVLLVYGWKLARFNMRQLSPAMGLPMGVPYAAVPAGAAVMLLHTLALIVARTWRSGGQQ